MKISARRAFQWILLVSALLVYACLSGRTIVQPSADIATGPDRNRSEPPAGYPDRYVEYLQGIKTADFEDRPSYEQNYLMDALSEARLAAKSADSPLPWVEHGPSNVGGRTRAIVVDARDPTHRTWYAASVSGGIWKTETGGTSWTHLTPALPNLAFSSLAQALSEPAVFYAGTGEGFFNGDAVSGAGIFKSLDGGQAWLQLPFTASSADFRFVNRLIISPTHANVVVAATREGIFRTNDGGASWLLVYRSPAPAGILQVIADPDNFDRQYATESGTGVYRSLDAGLTWQPASNGFFGLADGVIAADSRIELAIALSNTQRLYAAVESEGGAERLFTSADGGGLWLPVPPAQGSNDPDWAQKQGWYDSAIAVHPFKENIVYLGGIELYKATLSGTTTVGVLKSLDEENTQSFLDFVPFDTAPYFGGRLKTGLEEEGAVVAQSDFVSVEIRFGPGLSQKAHRFIPPDGPGIKFSTYPYADYVDVPFEVWDITNNRQLMVSFRDRLHDGVFDLIELDPSNYGREYIVVSAIPYNGNTPSPQIAELGGGGPLYKMLYFFWPILANGGTWNPADLPASTLRINYDNVTGAARTTSIIASASSIHVDQHTIVPIVGDEGTGQFNLVVGNDGGVFFSETGDFSWRNRNTGYNTSQFYGVDKRPGVLQFVGGTQDNGTWLSSANPISTSGWSRGFGGDGFDVAWNQQNSSNLLGAMQFNDFRRSTNLGQGWVPAKTGLTDTGDPDAGGGGQFMTVLDRSPDQPDVVFTVGKSGVWKSVNFGFTWMKRPIPASDWGFGGSGSVRVSLADGAIVWAGYEMGVSLTDPSDVLGRIHVSTDGGESFHDVPTPSSLSSGRISGLATHPTDPSTAYVLFSASNRAKILRTENLGQTWEDLSGFAGPVAKSGSAVSANGFPNVVVHDLLVLPHRPNEIWAGTEIGVVISRDDGVTWSLADNGLPHVSVWQLRIVDDQLVVATHGRGVWSVPMADVIAADTDPAEDPVELPGVFRLEQNFPNPFNPRTTIRFTVPSPSHVELDVFDSVGRRVARLLDETMPSGNHETSWDASSFASGVYVVRMRSESFVATRLITLLK